MQQFLPGDSVEGTIDLSSAKLQTYIPYNAVLYDASGSFVYVTRKDKKVKKQYVVLDEVSGKDVVVLDGLQPGEWIVNKGAGFISENSIISIQSDE